MCKSEVVRQKGREGGRVRRGRQAGPSGGEACLDFKKTRLQIFLSQLAMNDDE